MFQRRVLTLSGLVVISFLAVALPLLQHLPAKRTAIKSLPLKMIKIFKKFEGLEKNHELC